MKKEKSLIQRALVSCGVAIAMSFLFIVQLHAQGGAPKFQVDPAWPKPLPNLWVTGGVGGACVDSRDHVFILNRRDLSDNDLDAGRQAPVVIEFDPDGNVVNSFGDPDTTPDTPHGCTVDSDNNLWITGTGDGIVQKFTHDGGKLLLQIGKKGVVDSSDGTAKGKPLNSSHDGFFKPSGIAIDPKNGYVYVADGETVGGNHRIVVLDRTGQFLRQWDLHRADSDSGDFVPILHCVILDNSGLVYVCDRRGHRIQVFDKMGTFQKMIPVEFEPVSKLPAGPEHRSGGLGSTVGIEFSRDPAQKYMYVVNQDRERVDIFDHASGKLLSSFGGVGHYPGEFTYSHFIAVDSKGNIYVTEVGTGKRIQKFRLVSK
jgi:DNA-binding beta-propeller fold protein YncE